MNLNYSNDRQFNSLLKLLMKYEEIFDGNLGKHTDSDYTREVKEDAKPFPIPKTHKSTLKKEVDRLI